MPADRSPHAVLEEIASRPRGDDLARLVHTVAFAAADERRARIEDGLAELVERAHLKTEDAETSYGNVLRALERGGAESAGSATRALLAGLLARGVALSPPAGTEAEARVAESLVWLATNTSIDALTALDAALGDKAAGLWIAVGTLIRRVDSGTAPLVGRAGAIIAASALRESASSAAWAESAGLAEDARDPIVRALLAKTATAPADPAGPEAPETIVLGEVVPAPRGPIALIVLGFTGILAILHLARLLGQVALRYRRPAELRISPKGLVIHTKTEILGRTVKERDVHIPIEALLRATREIRYPRLALYVGLGSLAIGSYLGISIFVDGARAGSPELLGIGLLLVFVGIALDYVLSNIIPSGKRFCRVVFEPRKGASIALGKIDPMRADEALNRLKR
ncbi:MAG: hypothetical protein ABJE95_32070 [Byssovorax sp.]